MSEKKYATGGLVSKEAMKKMLEDIQEYFIMINETISELEIENKILKEGLDNACKMREDWDCPVSLGLIDDLDCENCKDTYKEC